MGWTRRNQNKVRIKPYRGLKDAIVKGDAMSNKIEKRCILQSSYTKSLRYKIQNYQDAMAICRWVGYLNLFLTFICNPKWPKIEWFLAKIEKQKIEDHVDIINRVFEIKL